MFLPIFSLIFLLNYRLLWVRYTKNLERSQSLIQNEKQLIRIILSRVIAVLLTFASMGFAVIGIVYYGKNVEAL